MKRFLTIIALFLAGVSASAAQGWWPRATPAHTGEYVWERLDIGGGGYVPQMDISQDGSRVAMTDVGSGHCWTAGVDTRWRPAITRTSMGFDINGGAWAPWSMAIAPSNSQVVYMNWSNSAGGTGNGGTFANLYRSTDGCHSWTKVNGVNDYASATTGAHNKFMSRHIAIDPRNPDVVYTCHPTQGVLRASDGVNFTAISLSTIPGTSLQNPLYLPGTVGCNGMAFDPTSAAVTCWTGSGTCTSVLHIPVYGWGVYGSNDGGTSFVRRSGVDPDTTYPNVTTTGANGVIVVWYATQSLNIPPIRVEDTQGLTWTQRPTNGCTIGTGNAQWYIRQWWAYAPNVTTTIKVVSANMIPGSVPQSGAIPFDGVDVSGASPFDVTNAICSSAGSTSLTMPSITPNSNDALVYSAQIVQSGPSLTVTTSDSVLALPVGTKNMQVSNGGATNNAYCNVNGVTATVADQLIAPASRFTFNVSGGVTTLHCITSSGNTTVAVNSATTDWTCIVCSIFAPGYSEYRQLSGSPTAQTPSPLGATATRGGFVDAMKTTGPGSVTVGTQVAGVNFTASPPQYVIKGQVSPCDGKYYTVEVGGTAHRYDPASPGSGFTQLTGGPSGGFGGIYPHPTDCSYLLAYGPANSGMRFVGLSGNQTTSQNYGATWASGKSYHGISGLTMDADNIPWYYYANAGVRNPSFVNSIDAGDGMWNPATLDFEMSTGFCYYKASIPKSNLGYTLRPQCEGIEITVPFVVNAISGGAYQNVFFSTHDVCMFPNLKPGEFPELALPVRNCLAGLAGCWDVQYNKHDPDIITTVCNEAIGAENSAYADLTESGNEGGRLQTDWRLLGGQQNSELGSFTGAGTANGNPIGSYVNGGFNGNFVANACDPDNAVFFTGGGNQESSGSWPGGRAFVTFNLRARGAIVVSASAAPDAGGSIITHNGSPLNAPGGGAIAVGQGLAWGGTVGATAMRSNPVVTEIIDSTHFRVDDVNLTLSSQTMLTGPAWVYLAQTEFSGAPTTGNYGWVNGYGVLHRNMTNDKVCNSGSGGAQFYAYNMVAQKMYSSPTGGPGTWTVLYNGNPVTASDLRTKMYSVPQEAGMLYMTAGPRIEGVSVAANYKMVKITNAHTGTPTITACPNTYMMYNVGMGAPKPGKGNNRPTLFATGYVGGTASSNYGLWRSDDDCATWTNIAPGLATGSQLGGPQPANDWRPASLTAAEGDFREYGKVYLNQYNALGYGQGRIQ